MRASDITSKIKMKTTSIKATLLIVTLFTAVVGLRSADTSSADVTTTPAFKAFLTNYVVAINSKQRAKLNECIHPKWVAMMAGDQKFSAEWFKGRFGYSIPAEFEANATAIPVDKPLPLADKGLVWPVKPTYQVQIKFKSTPTDIVYMVLWVACENDKWFEVLPSAPKKN